MSFPPLEILKKARELLTPEGSWSPCCLGLRLGGIVPCASTDGLCVSRSILGAILYVEGVTKNSDTAIQWVRNALPDPQFGLYHWEPRVTQGVVLSLLDQVILAHS